MGPFSYILPISPDLRKRRFHQVEHEDARKKWRLDSAVHNKRYHSCSSDILINLFSLHFFFFFSEGMLSILFHAAVPLLKVDGLSLELFVEKLSHHRNIRNHFLARFFLKKSYAFLSFA